MATLIRLLGDFDRAEDALHDAFRAALEQWPTAGVPANPSGWLISAGRFKAIDRLRRARLELPLEETAEPAVAEAMAGQPTLEGLSAGALAEADDRLRLIFTCCHPSLSVEARAAYQDALALTKLAPERRFLEMRLQELAIPSDGFPAKNRGE